MAEEKSGDRSEKPTQARRDDFRKQGQVAQTREFATAILLLLSAMGVYVLSRHIFNHMFELFNFNFGPDMIRIVKEGNISEALIFGGARILYMVIPILGVIGLVGVASSLFQIGFLNVENALTPDLNKINPVNGLKRLFSLKSIAEGIKAMLKLLGIGLVVYFLLKSEVKNIPNVINFSPGQIVEYLGAVVFKLLSGVGGAMLVIAMADYLYQRWDLEKRMMMTKQEVKEEHKQREGDPLIKSRIRRLQKERAQKRMMDEVPKGDVVITNPTHIAVVLKYSDDLPAPQLIAKGADYIAEKIKEVARNSNIPVIENKPLARTIFKTMKLGQVIPKELFVAVAEVLSYVYKLKKKKVKA